MSARNRVDLDYEVKFILDDLVERGYFPNIKDALASAVSALQHKLADQPVHDFDDAELEARSKWQLRMGVHEP